MAYRGSFFTDVYGLKFCVQFFCDVTQSVLLVSYTDVSGQPTSPTFKGQSDNASKNYHSMLREVPKDRRFHFILYYTFPAKPVLFLMENQHCRAIIIV
jgi:hypothetical protein